MGSYRVLSLYRRTVSAIPSLKALVRVRDLREAPIAFGEGLGQLCPDVIFRLLEDDTGKRYWAKRWLNERERLMAPTQAVESFLATLARTDLLLGRDIHPEFGLVYDFHEQLFASKAIVHHGDRARYFGSPEQRTIKLVASSVVRWPGLPRVRLDILTDFQITQTGQGLVFLDFEPSRRYTMELAGVRIP